jgi:D-alanyl-D-alanine carboxypeptidase/D-alanyl-D-alanine-endopeptidase (penicillin-binding protein 4)
VRPLLLLLLLLPSLASAGWKEDVQALAGADGVVYVLDESGGVVLDLGGGRAFIPASMLKIVTSLLAVEYLGLDSRFETWFWVDDGMLVVKGHGDPFLVSEELDLVATALEERLPGGLKGIAVDDSYFADGIVVPGVGDSDNPYDALNSALAVNFNTINVTVAKGEVVSAEDQTPLTPLAKRVAKARGVTGKARINLSDQPDDVRRYAAELIAAKLRAAGVEVGDAYERRTAPATEPLYKHANTRTVAESVHALLYYSNNYIANQVFLALGAKQKGAPATLDKSVAVAREFLAERPELAGIAMTEGSGISYDNRATGPSLAAALALFAPHKDLMRDKHGTPNKTGTLKVTKSVAGYLETKEHGTVRFVVSLDGGGSERRWKILEVLKAGL